MESELVAPLGIGAVYNGIAYYCDTIDGFLSVKPSDILDCIFKSVPFDERTSEQNGAWKDEISCLQARLQEIKAEGYIVFEYNIIRMAKRIDVVLLLRNVVYSLEFKSGQNTYYAEDMEQALDYALRLKAFHQMSRGLFVCPVLIATKAEKSFKNPCAELSDKTIGLQKTNKKELGRIIEYIDKKYGSSGDFDFNKWFWSSYNPSPSIVEAAVDAFNSVPVANIAHAEAGQDGIDACVKSVNDVIEYAKTNKTKCICFVTGVPGAGKTLVGLDIAARHSKPEDDLYSVYISGNGPLVDVLQTALADSWLKAGKVTSKGAGMTRAAALIQDGYEFRQACLTNPEPPKEKVLIFDEAQRAWNKEQVDSWSVKHKYKAPEASEPELTVRFMDRHDDWAVIVCLVGLGQDIHVGEAGINGWFDSIIDQHKGWEFFYSEDLFGTNHENDDEKNVVSHYPGSHIMQDLHLSVSVRSFRADKVSNFVNALVEADVLASRQYFSQIKENYPIFVTRDLALAKKWAVYKTVGSQRIGLIASSTSKDQKDNGVVVPTERYFDWPKWFLDSNSKDAGSSNSLSFAASEFKIQGLEIDWAIVSWGADFRYDKGEFKKYVYQRRWLPVEEYQYRLIKWVDKSRWITNAYRVNLTRARQGMVIFVPLGTDGHWDSNYHEFYDSTYRFLKDAIGIPELTDNDVPRFESSKTMAGPTEDGVDSKLSKLKSLFESGLITKDDYEHKKDEVLENVINDLD
jgi:DUF2075 family protein